MEIYRQIDTVINIALPVYTSRVTAVKVVGTDGVEVVPAYSGDSNATSGGKVLFVTPPSSSIKYDGVARVTINYDNFGVNTMERFVHVVSPYMVQSDFADQDFLEPKMSADAFRRLEKMVRNIINTYTKNEFGLYTGTTYATWSGNKWMFDKPVISITTFVGTNPNVVTYPTLGADVLNDYYDPKTDTYQVANTYSPWSPRREPKRAAVTGVFGYEYVPFEVHDAAMHLAEVFGCNESMWRDRYIESMKSADWSLKFNSAAYYGTGSVYADQLLDNYKTSGMVVL